MISKQTIGNIRQGSNNITPPQVVNAEAEKYMQHSMIESQEELANISQEHAPQVALSEAFERVDPYTLEIIAKLFPAPTSGLEFVARILRFATIKQNVLPGLEDLGDYVAVISTRTIRTLASMIHWGYDTTHKYVTTFCALGLLRKYKQNSELQLVFPLQHYSLPQSLSALDKLITKSRPKVQQFAKRVKGRLLQLQPTVLPETIGSTVPELPECDPRLKKALFGPMLAVLQAEGLDSTKGRNIALRLVSEVIGKFILPMKVVSEQELRAHKVALPGRSTASQSTIAIHEKAESISKYSTSEVESTLSAREGRLSVEQVSSSGRQKIQKVSLPNTLNDTYTDRGRLGRQKVSRLTAPGDTSFSASKSTPESSPIDLYGQAIQDRIDWEQAGLPTDFFIHLHEEIKSYYDDLEAKGLLCRTKGTFWKSIEKSLIRRLAEAYGVDFTYAYNIVVQNTGRAYLMLAETFLTTTAQVQVSPVHTEYTAHTAQENFNPEQYHQMETTASAQPDVEEDSMAIESYQESSISTEEEDRIYQSVVDEVIIESTPSTIGLPQTVDQNTPEVDQQEDQAAWNEILASMTDEENERYRSNQRALQALREHEARESTRERARYLRIPEKVDQKKYNQTFLRNYVTKDIITLFNNIYNNITLRNELSIFFADVFDRNQVGEAEGWYKKLLNDCNAEQLCAGFIDTIVLLHRPTKKPINQPGGFFNKRCAKCKDKGLNDSTRSRLQKYGQLTYEQLVDEMVKLARQYDTTQ